IYISTDYVFSGENNVLLNEDATVDPINIYGKTKLLGELAALQENKEAVILRTSWVYSRYGKNFVKTMCRLMREREYIEVVNDQFGSPTYAKDLAEVVQTILQAAVWAPGVYHYSNSGKISWFDFALAIRDFTDAICEVRPV